MKMKVKFYILNTNNRKKISYFICQLTEKVLKKNHCIQILLSSNDDMDYVDNLLWSYKQKESFIPHLTDKEITEENQAVPVVLTTNSNYQMPSVDILLSLNNAIYPRQDFNHILYIIDNQENSLKSARDLYKHYKTQNIEIDTHKIQLKN